MTAVLGLRIDLLDDLVMSRSAASSGGHRSLGHIPGAVLRGLFAGLLYTRPGIDAYRLFHSGEVAFGDGWPLTENARVALPTPRSLHYKKGEKGHYRDGSRLYPEHVYNRARGDPDAEALLEPLPDPYLAPADVAFAPRLDMRMKTAIDGRTGRSAEAQLFGYQALEAGQSFLALIEGPSGHLDRLRDVSSGRTLRIGRSKQAEFGRIAIEAVDLAPDPLLTRDEAGERAGGDLVFWALSDLALVDDAGNPTVVPTPSAFCGTSGYRYCPERSWLRFRRYLPWNAKWGMPMLERVVVAAGSVLVFAPTAEAAPPKPARWLGSGRECGLGRVWPDPPALAQERLAPWQAPRIAVARATPATASPRDEALLAWLDGVANEEQQRRDLMGDVDKSVATIIDHYKAAAAFAGEGTDVLIGPGVSQWRQLATLVSEGTRGELHKSLFDDKTGLARVTDDAWTRRYGSGAGDTFRDWLRAETERALEAVAMDEALPPAVRARLHSLANAIADRLRKEWG